MPQLKVPQPRTPQPRQPRRAAAGQERPARQNKTKDKAKAPATPEVSEAESGQQPPAAATPAAAKPRRSRKKTVTVEQFETPAHRTFWRDVMRVVQDEDELKAGSTVQVMSFVPGFICTYVWDKYGKCHRVQCDNLTLVRKAPELILPTPGSRVEIKFALEECPEFRTGEHVTLISHDGYWCQLQHDGQSEAHMFYLAALKLPLREPEPTPS